MDVARAFLLKYNIDNKFVFTTIASTRQLDEHRFEIVRRMENVMSSRPVYERIIFNRDQQSVQGFTFEKESDISYTECYMYKQDMHDATKTIYNMFLYKNPGLKKFLRFKLHSWGVSTLEQIVKKELEMKTKLRESKERMIEQKDKLLETKDKLKERLLSDLKGTVSGGNKKNNQVPDVATEGNSNGAQTRESTSSKV